MLRRPIIATDISGARDILDNGRYGTLVAPEDADGISRAIQEFLSERKSAETRAVEGRNHILKYMDAKRVADEHIRVYREVLHT
jgi:glycosyltransferase involved in cell wall biosynthesis